MRTKRGVVTSDKMEKTVVVSVNTYKTHPKYKKRYRVTNKFYADTNNIDVSMGDEVVINETKPLSKTKRWILVEVVTNESK